MSRNAPVVDLAAFRADQQAVLDDGSKALMTGERARQEMFDTNIVIQHKWVDPDELPEEMRSARLSG